ncbi:MAG: hypothetical protein WCQ49_01720 [Candidatus Saccharibacteria bacterium]
MQPQEPQKPQTNSVNDQLKVAGSPSSSPVISQTPINNPISPIAPIKNNHTRLIIVIAIAAVLVLSTAGAIFYFQVANKPALVVEDKPAPSDKIVTPEKPVVIPDGVIAEVTMQIKEWGLKGTYNSDTNLVYEILSAEDKVDYINIHPVNFKEQVSCGDVTCAGFIQRYDGDADYMRGTTTGDTANVESYYNSSDNMNETSIYKMKKIGDHYFKYYGPAQGVPSEQATLDKLILNIQEIFNSLTEI